MVAGPIYAPFSLWAEQSAAESAINADALSDSKLVANLVILSTLKIFHSRLKVL